MPRMLVPAFLLIDVEPMASEIAASVAEDIASELALAFNKRPDRDPTLSLRLDEVLPIGEVVEEGDGPLTVTDCPAVALHLAGQPSVRHLTIESNTRVPARLRERLATIVNAATSKDLTPTQALNAIAREASAGLQDWDALMLGGGQ